MKGAITILDTNLMVLLIVGPASREYILRHKRTQPYTIDDFVMLQQALADSPSIVAVPHVLVETENLVRQFAEPGPARICSVLQSFIFDCIKTTVASSAAARRPEFRRLGLTDAALLEVQNDVSILLTDDLDLYVASVSAGRHAINFSHLRAR